jgi:hypothetical protein
MTDPWLIQRKSGTDGFTYRRVGYGPDYEFTYDDVTKQFDYFRGYISKESQQRVSKTQAKDQYDEIVTKHNYATRVPLPSLATATEPQNVSWETITTKEGWDYVPPEQLSDIQQCRKELNEMDERLAEAASIETEVLDMLDQVQLETALSKKLLQVTLDALKSAGIVEGERSLEDLMRQGYQDLPGLEQELQKKVASRK